jgi:transcription antitermination factor NusG
MPYMMTVPGNRKKKIQGILKRQGIRHTWGPVDGYLIAYGVPQKVLENLLPGLEVIAPVSQAEIETMLRMASAPIKTIGVKDMVKVISGKYCGFRGIVTRVDDKEVSIGINIFGKVVPVTVGREDIEKEATPDWV